MVTLVADTHAIVWHLTAPKKLGRAARRALDAADSGRSLCYVPAIALVEVALLNERGRLRVGPAQIIEALGGHAGFSVLPLDIEQALEFTALPAIRDPMDRLVVAAARATNSRLVSCDEACAAPGVVRVWD